MPSVSVASFNAHAGIDGWGRRYDCVEACALMDADVIVMQEDFAADGEQALAEEVAGVLGYAVRRVPLAAGRRLGPPAHPPRAWGPRPSDHARAALRLSPGAGGHGTRRQVRQASGRTVESGQWGLAVLSRLPVSSWDEIDLGKLRRDPARRTAIVALVDAGRSRLAVVGTHMSHMSYGSPLQYGRLRRALGEVQDPAVVAGDMNMFGRPVELLLPGWRRAVRGRSWPAWRPIAQADHILVRRGVQVSGGCVVRAGESDHLPVRIEIELD